MERQTPKKSPIGQPWNEFELSRYCDAVYGAVAWPGKRPGFAVVVARDRDQHFDGRDVYLLDEFESDDYRELVYQCGVLDLRYRPSGWFGESMNDAADCLIREMNREPRHRPFCIFRSALVEMKRPYGYFLPELKRLLDPERRQLFLKDGRVLEHLQSVKMDDELGQLGFGDYPAVEALALAVIEIRSRTQTPIREKDHKGPDFDWLGRNRFLEGQGRVCQNQRNFL